MVSPKLAQGHLAMSYVYSIRKCIVSRSLNNLNNKLRIAAIRDLFSSLLTVKPLAWQKVLESFRMMKGLFSRVQLIILDCLTKEM